MSKQIALVLPDEWRDDHLVSPEVRMTKQNLIQQAETCGLGDNIVYKSEYTPCSREKHIESVLRKLIDKHFFSKDLEWIWKEGYKLKEVDTELWVQIYELFPDVVNTK